MVDPRSRAIVWSAYRRHEMRLADTLLALLLEIGNAFAVIPLDHVRVFITGSGTGPLSEPLGAKFVQEVNAVTMAVDALHCDAGSVVELSGHDAQPFGRVTRTVQRSRWRISTRMAAPTSFPSS